MGFWLNADFLSLYLLTACSLGGKRFGDWTVRLPEDGDCFYAVGGPSTERIVANDQARAEMAKFISVTVDSEIERATTERSGQVETKILDTIRLQAKETMKNLSIVEVKKIWEGYYALARMPSRPMEKILDSLRFKKMPPTVGEIGRSVVLPGWGQIKKSQQRKGFSILSAQAVAIGGTILFSILKSSADENMIYARTAGVRRAYQQDSQTFRSLMFGSLITATAIYIYNLVDATAVPKKVPLGP